MPKPDAWGQTDKVRVRAALQMIVASPAIGTWEKLAEALGCASRAVPHAWHRRGQVPSKQVRALLKLAPPQLNLKPADLSPAARDLEN